MAVVELGLVPDVAGMLFAEARALAAEGEIALANPDADGAPIGAMAWPGSFVIVAQEPSPGSRLPRWGSLKVWIEPSAGGSPVAAPSGSPDPPPPAAVASPLRRPRSVSSTTVARERRAG